MGIRWVINPRTAAFLLQASMCLGPGRWFVGILNPMGQGGLIAPFGELRHDAAMHPRAHEGAHARLVSPHCAGPESAIGIAKDRNREAPIRELRLARRAQRLDHKARQIPPNPNPKSRDGHKRHKPIIPRAEPDLLARRDRGRGARCGPRSRMLASAAVSPATGGCCNRSLTIAVLPRRNDADRDPFAALFDGRCHPGRHGDGCPSCHWSRRPDAVT